MNPARDVTEHPEPGALDFIWARMARPLNTVPAVSALLGMRMGEVRQMVGATVAGSDAAEHLLDLMPRLLRTLSVSTTTIPQRCIGEIRGPVLWSETMSARSATAGDPGIFVCSKPSRAYDTPDNQVLVSALDAIRRAGVDVDRAGAEHFDEDLLRRARVNASRAVRYFEHRSLVSIQLHRPNRRTIQRARAGRRPSFEPAMAMLETAYEPVEVADLRRLCDAHTTSQHDLLQAVVRDLENRGLKLPHFHIDKGVLRTGPLSYRHTKVSDTDEVRGVRLGTVLFDVPDHPAIDRDSATAALSERTPEGMTPQIVFGRADLARGVQAALGAGL